MVLVGIVITPIHEDLRSQTVRVQLSLAGLVVETPFHEDLRSQKVLVHMHINILCHKHAILKCHLCSSNVIIVLYISLMTV